MNLELLNPFSQSFPEGLETSFDAAANSVRFNPRGVFAGHFLAVGRVDGVAAVLDFETKGIVRWLEGHVQAVTTVCWSRNSRYLLTASRDWNAIIWDLSAEARDTAEGERKHTVRFDAPVTSAHLHPCSSKMLVVTLFAQVQPVFVDLRAEVGGRWELELPKDEEEEDEEEDEDEEVQRKHTEIATICRFNPKGDLIYVGTSKGNIHIWDVMSKEHLWTESVGSRSAIRHLEFDRTGSALATNSNDRVIRVFSLHASPPDQGSDADEDVAMTPPESRPPRVPYFELRHKFQDLVNKTPWNGIGFSRDGEYVIGGAGHKASHNIYMWDRDSGGLVKILEGPKDPLEDLDWHPLRPLIASVSSLGNIHVWVTRIIENWSAYAPEFEELDENQEYQEKEDEFDFEDESVTKRRKADEQDKYVDIMTVDQDASGGAQERTVETEVSTERGVQAPRDAYDDFVRIELDGDDNEAFYPPPDIDPNRDDPDEVVTDKDLLFGLLPPEKEVMRRKLERQREEKRRLEQESARIAAARRTVQQTGAQVQAPGQNGQNDDQPPPSQATHWRKRRKPKKQWT